MNIKFSNKIAFIFSFLFVMHNSCLQATTNHHLVIVGSGIAAAVESLLAFYDSIKKEIALSITIFEKNASICESTATQIAPSLTPDEIVSVVPRGPALVEKSRILFNLPGGIRVDDVAGINGSQSAEQFMQQANKYSIDELCHAQRTQDLLALGKMSMDLWQYLYDTADIKLQEIFKASNFNPCRPTTGDVKILHDGYRIDLIFNVPNALDKAIGMKSDYEQLGYDQCAILTPTQVVEIDPSLQEFCKDHSMVDDAGNCVWNNDTVALWRPGGCLDVSVFIPRLYAYLQQHMGDNFKIYCSHKVTGVEFGMNDAQKTIITGLNFENHAAFHPEVDANTEYLFCPGEAVGTLQSLGFAEPAYAGFAGVALKLTIDIPQGHEVDVAHFNHCMEVHQQGIVLAWQARLRDNKIFIAVGGTKAFYADQTPHKNQEFAIDRNILQLNMINNVLPEFVSWAFGRDTRGTILSEQDLYNLESMGIAQRWVGTRAVAYDGFPTLGYLYKNNEQVVNGRCTTHLGSGGVSFAPAVAKISRTVFDNVAEHDEFTERILQFSSSLRTA
ncbi:MAG: hypothetical protein JO129_03265 [Candidatus Dependentiae bacterium]|nr:hypothetical protein [Candidatus Dependentiae bacterium]